MAKKNKSPKLMKKRDAIILFAVCAVVLIAAVAALIYLGSAQ